MTPSLIPDHIQGRNPHYVNHDAELAEATDLIVKAEGNLVIAFTGVAGSGKTATAWELAFRVKSLFGDGVLFADLRGSLDREGAEAEILRTFLVELGVDVTTVPDRVAALRARYQAVTSGRKILVLVDGAVRASQVRSLLPGDGRSLVLVTASQSVSDLAVDLPAKFFELSPLTDEAAIELLERLLGAERVAAEQDAVVELIALCGRLPIALCVVASMLGRPRNRTIANTVERLRDERRRLAALSPPTDLSVAGAFTTAYRQLGDSAQRCYRALGLAPRLGRVSAEALAAALDTPFYDVAESLAELCDSHFIEVAGQDRYLVSDLVALHAAYVDERPPEEKAAESARLIAFYHQRSFDADAMISPGRPWREVLFPDLWSRESFDDAATAIEWLEEERQSLTTLIEYAFREGDFERVGSWCVLLWPFYEAGKHIGDLLAAHQRGIDAADALEHPLWESLIQVQKGFGHRWLGELEHAVTLFTAAAARAAGHAELEATAVEALGLAQLEQGHPDALATLRGNLALAKEIGDPRRIALAQFHLSKAEVPETALPLLAAAKHYFDSVSDEVNQAKCDTWLGKHLFSTGRPETAAEKLAGAVDFMAGRGRRFDQAEALVALGDIRSAAQRTDDARDCWNEALGIYADLGFTARAEDVRRRSL